MKAVKIKSTTMKETRIIQDGLRDIHWKTRRTNNQLGKYPLGGPR